MTTIALHPVPLVTVRVGPPIARFLRAIRGGMSVTDVVVAASLVAAMSATVLAEERTRAWVQDWVPAVLSIPEDAEVVRESAIGSSIRMVSFSTDADVDRLFADWEESLTGNGYTVRETDAAVSDRSIEFSGPGILNASITEAAVPDGDRTVIELEASLN